MKLTVFLFGLFVGLWCSTWLAMAHPALPFALAYPVIFWTVWRLPVRRR